MTYLQWLRRYVELAIGEGNSTADTASVGSPWLADTWRDRFEQMLQRAEARLHPQDFGPIQTLFTDAGLLDNPQQAIAALLARYPDAETVQLHPADVPFFVTLCKTLGKPVNFVPVIDQDVRRWWRSDSLWQAHDARYDADAVCIIPGTASVAGITRMDEPVGELLDRFEQAAIDEVLGAGVEPKDVASRRLGRADVAGPLAVVLDAPDVRWAGRTVTNPVHRIADPAEWQVHDGPENPRATHSSTGARLQTHGDDVALSVPVSGTWVDIRFTLPANTVDGGTPVIATEDATSAMRTVLAIAAGVDSPEFLPAVANGTATLTVDWHPERVADHTGVTATFGEPLAPSLTNVPDALVGPCWPAVFAAIGSAVTDTGEPVVEGLLSLVHLDHAARVVGQLPTVPAQLTVTATAANATDTDMGRVVPVSVVVTGADGAVIATLEERFAILGRTGSAELADPARAGGAVSANATDTPRRRRRDVTITAPVDMRPFAVVSGDHNPIHTDRAAALLAGLESPIVHGMWLSAAAQHAVTATDGQARPPARLVGWTRGFGHGAPRRRGGLPRRARRNRPGRRDCGRGRARRVGSSDVGLRATGRTQDGLRIPRPGHPTQGHGHGGARPLQGGPQGVGHRGQVHPRHPGLLGTARGPRQPDQHHRQRCALPPPRRGALPDAVHPGRDGDGGGRAGRRDA